MSFMRGLWAIIAGMWVSITCYAQQDDIRFYDQSKGLSQHSVAAIAQDNKGFLWIGTRHGINRYDGKIFKNFDPQKSWIPWASKQVIAISSRSNFPQTRRFFFCLRLGWNLHGWGVIVPADHAGLGVDRADLPVQATLAVADAQLEVVALDHPERLEVLTPF